MEVKPNKKTKNFLFFYLIIVINKIWSKGGTSKIFKLNILNIKVKYIKNYIKYYILIIFINNITKLLNY